MIAVIYQLLEAKDVPATIRRLWLLVRLTAVKFEYRRPLLLYLGGGIWHHKFRKETTVKLGN